ncbi:S-adenosyl-L-methionine-dependent methyltransferase [Linnemannia elongata AG-77]|uniref:Protein-lysine N-methyltransferase EFM4 n=1 Tax=Linnemannia elongata AG-77 TaxID=1314771 RepID=A0A197JC13_9FUNG|nr:S-adenosyl-L-methionine-dependent methyltransferase [Linnemannia elongata AG-77]
MSDEAAIPQPDFKPSKLGTKDYWDKVYNREVINFKDHGDIGEIWFGEDSAVKMVDWVEEHYEGEKETCAILDLGCGNGHLLLDLAELGFEDLTGIDYSPAAIELAKAVAEDKEVDHIIKYEAVDFLAEKETLEWCAQQATPGSDSHGEPKKFKVMLDKGTYDAISLHQKSKADAVAAAAAANADADSGEREDEESVAKDNIVLAENDDNMEELADRYPKRVASMMRDDGRLLITSCNWTQPELIQRFSQYFEYDCHLKYPTFTFGGVKGQTISSVVFRKK